MERFRLKVNGVATQYVLQLEGCYIKYPDLIKQNIEQFLLSDGVHLNDLKLICT